jgi:predicted nucleic acid-binding protein
MLIVADTGPLLHLHWTGASSWALPPLPIDVVDVVWKEVASYAPEALDDVRLRRVASPTERPPEMATLMLDDGEAAAIAYALQVEQRHDALLLCDERRARRACERLALPVVGSIGLVVEARRAGRVTRAEAVRALSELPERGRLHVSPELVRAAIEALT